MSTRPLSGGLSNANHLVSDTGGRHVVRFGEDYPFHHVSRARELAAAQAAHAAGFAPKVEYAAPGVLVTAFVEARTFSAQDVLAEAAPLGALLRRFHDEMPKHISGEPGLFWVFHTIREYLRVLRDSKLSDSLQFDRLFAQTQQFETAQIAMPIVFGHHDLLPANFLHDGSRLWLIDFEYAAFGTGMFDLACASSHAGMSPAIRDEFLRSYLGHAPDSEFLRAFSAMECASLLRESLWASVSSLYLAVPGVDYTAYAAENRLRYEAALNRHHAHYGMPAS